MDCDYFWYSLPQWDHPVLPIWQGEVVARRRGATQSALPRERQNPLPLVACGEASNNLSNTESRYDTMIRGHSVRRNVFIVTTLCSEQEIPSFFEFFRNL